MDQLIVNLSLIAGIVSLGAGLAKALMERRERKKSQITATEVDGIGTRGIFDEAALIGDNIVSTSAAALPQLASLHQLLPPPADFTGRKAELDLLREAVLERGVRLVGLFGQGGVGKTALALKLAAELAPSFPDAQIYINLKGVAEDPLSPTDIFLHVLRAFFPETQPTEGEENLRAQYLSALHDKSALLLLDNARDAAQVQILIPPEKSALLITSRRSFSLPGLRRETLHALPSEDATDLLLRIEPRINGSARAMAEACGNLPLALRLAATAVAVRADLDPVEYTRELADEGGRMKLLVPPDDAPDKSIEASFTLSYNLLDAELQTRWRMLAVFPDSFDVSGTAVIWGLSENIARVTLGRLLQFSLLEWYAATKRYRLPNLMRAFAKERLSGRELNTVGLRHAKHYLDVLGVANDLYLRGGESLQGGLELFDLEWGNIQAGHAWAAGHANSEEEAARLSSDYPDRGVYVLDLRQSPRERIYWRELALAAARNLGDRASGYHLGNLAIAYADLGDYHRAVEFHEARLQMARESGDRRSEGQTLGNMGIAYAGLGEYSRAIEYHEQSLAVAREVGDRRGEGATLENLGDSYSALGQHPRAVDYYQRAFEVSIAIGDRRGERNALTGLGKAYGSMGEFGQTVEYFERSLAITRSIRDPGAEADVESAISFSLQQLGRYQEAIFHAEAALRILEQIGSSNAANVRQQLGVLRNA